MLWSIQRYRRPYSCHRDACIAADTAADFQIQLLRFFPYWTTHNSETQSIGILRITENDSF